MSIAWNVFTPWQALAGGLLIGLATALYLLGNGRVAGIASIVASPLRAPWLWRWFAPLPNPTVDVGTLSLISAGLLVGVGVRMGNGCTSGHGVCGLSRLSMRSLVNVLAFMAAGVATVTVLRHGL